MLTLAIDVGGTSVKVTTLDESGLPVTHPSKKKTPTPATPDALLAVIQKLVRKQPQAQRCSVGFPGVVTAGVVQTAPNLGNEYWTGVDLQAMLAAALALPVKVANDADVQGCAAVEGQGVEMVVTLGTGFGSALFVDGVLVPNLEFGHHPFKDGETYEQLLGKKALETAGRDVWRTTLAEALDTLHRIFNPRTIYVGGGHAHTIDWSLPDYVQKIDNVSGLTGGIRLWAHSDE